MAAQLILSKGLSARSLRLWMASATISLPVPLSPWMSTVTFVGAIWRMSALTACIAGLSPIKASTPASLLKLAAQLPVLAAQPLFLQRLGHGLQQGGAVDRLLDEIISAQPHRLHGLLDAAMPGDHHHFDLGLEFAGGFQERDAVQVRQAQVADHQPNGLRL